MEALYMKSLKDGYGAGGARHLIVSTTVAGITVGIADSNLKLQLLLPVG
jgi:hypothetical protein